MAAMAGMAVERLRQERRAWRKNHPHGFFARASRNSDGSTNMMKWQCGVPGKAGTPWEGGCYKISMDFGDEYPVKPPICKFTPVIFHPNVYPSGRICLSILSEDKGWQPTITVKQILLGIQDLLDNPNNLDPAQREPHLLLATDKEKYNQRIRLEASKHPPL